MNKSYEMAKKLLVESVWKSVNLEGLNITYLETKSIMNNIPTNTPVNDVLFITNMKRAWEFLLKDSYDNRYAYNLSVSLLQEYNKICGDKLFYGCGKMRRTGITIEGTSWTPDIPTHRVIRESLEDILLIEDIELRALKLFCFIARSHIFIDGNKRVAQLAANKILIENDKGIFQIPIIYLETFKSLLLKYYETGNDADILSFMRESCIIRPNQVKQTKDSPDKYTFSIKQEPFNLSDKQLIILNKVLDNIVRMLSSIEMGTIL